MRDDIGFRIFHEVQNSKKSIRHKICTINKKSSNDLSYEISSQLKKSLSRLALILLKGFI